MNSTSIFDTLLEEDLLRTEDCDAKSDNEEILVAIMAMIPALGRDVSVSKKRYVEPLPVIASEVLMVLCESDALTCKLSERDTKWIG